MTMPIMPEWFEEWVEMDIEGEFGGWKLKEGAPEEVKEEFKKLTEKKEREL